MGHASLRYWRCSCMRGYHPAFMDVRTVHPY